MDRHEPKGDEKGFRKAVRAIAEKRAEPEYIKRLAERFGMNEDRALKLAHDILGVRAFKRGVGKNFTPLEADAPRGCDVQQDRCLAGG